MKVGFTVHGVPGPVEVPTGMPLAIWAGPR